jgi:sugar phosphate isomerase/epimerase
MIAGISTACFFPKLYIEQAVQKIGEMNVQHIEVFFSTLSEYRPAFINEFAKIVADSGTDVYSVHALSLQFEPQLFSSHRRSRQDSLDIYEQVLEAGAILGAKVYVMHGPAHVKRACPLNLNYEYVAKRVKPLAELAKSYGIKLSWENVHWCWYAQPDFPEKLEPYLNTDNLFYTLDVKQAAQAKTDPISFVKGMGTRLVNVHICDYINLPEKGIVPELPFRGEANFKALKDALEGISYDGAIMLEVYNSNYRDYDELKRTYDQVVNFFIK